MNSIIHKSTTPFGAIVIAVLILVAAIAVVVPHVTKAESADLRSGRLITIHDRGSEKVIVSQASTIGEALTEAAIEVGENDIVEPAASEELVASDYQVNIYRARPVVIVDGMSRQSVMTPYQTGTQIAKNAGVDLYPEDTTEFERADNIATEGVGLLLVIDRATPFEFTFYGKTTTVRTQGHTVGEMLKEKGIKLGNNDQVSPSKETVLTEGLDIKVWREGKQTITAEESVKFETEQIRDADREIGYSAIRTAGEEGLRTVTYEIVIRDGKEVSRTEIASITTKQPKKQVEVIGTKSNAMPYTGGGNKTEWLAASNIPEESWGYADFMVGRESSWNPNAVNASSGACGLAQALPCSKVSGNPYDPVNSLNWMNGYVNGRYGGWQGAYNFWTVNKWY